jgi:DNA-directed RNA polymerase specialized sigma24 family protein
MPLQIDKAEMDQAWVNRHKSDKFYKYCYDIARHQVYRKVSRDADRLDYIQFCVLKCFKHQEAYKPSRNSSTYSFFWKQIALAIAYKARKEARRNTKARAFYIEQEKVLDWIELQQETHDGTSFSEIVDEEELILLKKTFKAYNSCHKRKLKPSRENAKRVLTWAEKKNPGFLNQFTTLKNIFKSWVLKESSTR